MTEILIRFALGSMLAACAYLSGWLSSRVAIYEQVLRPWLDWRQTRLADMREATAAGDSERFCALVDEMSADMAAYNGVVSVLYKTRLPWQSAEYTRGDA